MSAEKKVICHLVSIIYITGTYKPMNIEIGTHNIKKYTYYCIILYVYNN